MPERVPRPGSEEPAAHFHSEQDTQVADRMRIPFVEPKHRGGVPGHHVVQGGDGGIAHVREGEGVARQLGRPADPNLRDFSPVGGEANPECRRQFLVPADDVSDLVPGFVNK